MRAPTSRMFKDLVVVHAPASGVDADGAPDLTPGAAGSPIACSVQEVTRGQGTAPMTMAGPFGQTEYEILLAIDPGVSKAEQKIAWTHHHGEAMSTPITLTSTGPARPPKGLAKRWTVSAISHR